MADKKKSVVESAAPASDKKKALETAMAQIEKTYGKGSIMRLGDNTDIVVEAIPTGSLSLDLALGIGGVPKGRIVEIYGPESSGKTTLALHIVAEAQKRGGEVAFIDAEHALDPSYARALGVDIDSMLISQPDTGEQGLEICEALVRSGAIDVVVVDSVAALTPRAEIEGDMGDSHVGLLAARPLSRKELVDKLTARPRSRDKEPLADRETAQAAADRLEELGYLNDQAYAHTVAEHYAAKGCGPSRIREELYRRGVPREFWDEALEGLDAPDDAIDAFLQKKLRGADLTDPRSYQRAADALARRGFRWEDIKDGLRRYGGAMEEEF